MASSSATLARASSPISFRARPRCTSTSGERALPRHSSCRVRSRQRRLLLTRQDVAAVGGLGQALVGLRARSPGHAVVGDVPVCVARHVFGQAGLQAREPFEIVPATSRWRVAASARARQTRVARVLQEARHVGAQPTLIGVAGRPQAKTTALLLHACQRPKALSSRLARSSRRERLQAHSLGPGFVNEHQRVSAAGGLLQAAIGVHQQATHGIAHIDGRLVGQAEVDGRPSPPSKGSITLASSLKLLPGSMRTRPHSRTSGVTG
jgi:hypothetical protein